MAASLTRRLFGCWMATVWQGYAAVHTMAVDRGSVPLPLLLMAAVPLLAQKVHISH
jgi:hypothetical protein